MKNSDILLASSSGLTFTPPLSPTLALGRMLGEGWDVSLSLLHSLFGEFAYDSNQSSVLVLQPLVVRSQVS